MVLWNVLKTNEIVIVKSNHLTHATYKERDQHVKTVQDQANTVPDIMQGNIYIYWSLEEGEGPGMLDGRGGGETNGDGEGRAVVVVMTTIGTNLSFTPWLLGQLSNKTHFQ